MVIIFTNCFSVMVFSGSTILLMIRDLSSEGRCQGDQDCYQDLFCNYRSWIRDVCMEFDLLLMG